MSELPAYAEIKKASRDESKKREKEWQPREG
jgi:hypothetical protein